MEKPQYVNDVILKTKVSMEMSSPFKNATVAFNWLNRDYPIYHEHSHWEVLLILEGEICHNINENETVIKAGDACLIRPTDRHSLTLKKEYRNKYQQINFTFSDSFARKLLDVYGMYEHVLAEPAAIQFSIDDNEMALIKDKTLLAQNLSQEDYEMSTKTIISRLVASFLDNKILHDRNYPDWLNELIVVMNNPNSFSMSTKELAGCTPYSYSRLTTLFKSYVGMTITEYMNEKRMVYAKRLLSTTKLTTLQISEMIGYNSLSSFNHLFKDVYGITPSEYRKSKSS